MEIDKRYQGASPDRYDDNPLERAFAEYWQARQKDRSWLSPTMIEYWLDPENRGRPDPPITYRENLLANTLIQWLGSPVGQRFLIEVLNDLRASDLVLELAEVRSLRDLVNAKDALRKSEHEIASIARWVRTHTNAERDALRAVAGAWQEAAVATGSFRPPTRRTAQAAEAAYWAEYGGENMNPEDKARFDAIHNAVSHGAVEHEPEIANDMMFLCTLVRGSLAERDALRVLRVAWKGAAYEYAGMADHDRRTDDALALDEEYQLDYGPFEDEPSMTDKQKDCEHERVEPAPENTQRCVECGAVFVSCQPCGEAGGAERAVFHMAPTCDGAS